MEDVDGMIGGLVELIQDAHVAVGKGGCSENGIAEIKRFKTMNCFISRIRLIYAEKGV